MASIADLFLKVVADTGGFTTTVVKDATKAGDQAAASMAGRLKAGLKGAFSKGGAGGGLLAGLGLGAGLGAVGIATAALSKLGDVMGDATQAALEEEVSVRKLDASLRANVSGYDGNTAAIERVLKSRMALGFSDDEQRDSLARLVVATKNSTKALAVQRVAMDLARLKGISLADASDALIKVEGGQFRALKALGIQLPKNATATEALAAVEKVAAGQAQAYAETNEGKLLASQVKVGEAMETFGAVTLPLVVTATEGAATAVTTFAGVLDLLNGKTPETIDQGEQLIVNLTDIGASLPFVGSAFKVLGQVAQDNMTDVSGESERMRGRVEWATDGTVTAIEDVGDESESMEDRVKRTTENAATYYDTLRQNVVTDTGALIDEAFDPLTEELNEQNNHWQILADIQKRESAKGKAAVAEANSAIVSDLDKQGKQLVTLGDRHELTAKDVDKYEKDVKASYATMGKKIPPEIQKVISKLRTLAGFDGKSTTYHVKISASGGKLGPGAKPHAVGGPVAAGQTYLVGERGPELITPTEPGYVHTAAATKSMARAAAGGTFGATNYNTQIRVEGVLPVRTARDLVGTMIRAGEIGALPGRRIALYPEGA